MKKIAKISLATAAAIAATLQASGLTNAKISHTAKTLEVTIGKSKKTLLSIKKTDLTALSGTSLAVVLDPQTGKLTLTDSLTSKKILSKKIDKSLFAKSMKHSIKMIAAYGKGKVTLQLSMSSKAQKFITLTKKDKSLIAGKWSMLLKSGKWSMLSNDGNLSIGKQHIELHSILSSLLGCTETSCKLHDKNAHAIAANNPDYKEMLKKAA